MTRKLTDAELREWGETLSGDESFNGLDSEIVLRMMRDTAGNAYDAGLADYEFDATDAKRMLELMTERH